METVTALRNLFNKIAILIHCLAIGLPDFLSRNTGEHPLQVFTERVYTLCPTEFYLSTLIIVVLAIHALYVLR